MTPTSRAELERVAEACDARATLIEAKSHARGEPRLTDPIDIENRDDLRTAARILRSLANLGPLVDAVRAADAGPSLTPEGVTPAWVATRMDLADAVLAALDEGKGG